MRDEFEVAFDQGEVGSRLIGRPQLYDVLAEGRTLSRLVGAEVHPADVQDRDGAGLVIEAIHQLFPWLRHLFADSAYNGPQSA